MGNSQDKVTGEFSAFCRPICCNGYIRDQWQIDRHLQRSLEILVEDMDCAIDAWARYFLLTLRHSDRDSLESAIHPLVVQAPEPNQAVLTIHRQLLNRLEQPSVREFWQKLDQSRRFLTAHLQKPCWFAAKKIYEARIVPSKLTDQCSLEDCFQTVNEWAGQPDRLLKGFQLTRPNIQIKTYAESVLETALKKQIQKLGILPEDSSDWGLLRYVSESELQAALRSQGLRSDALARAILLWQSFKTNYKTRQKAKSQLPPPDDAQLEQICDRYEQQRSRHSLSEQLQLSQIIPLLHTYAEAVRAYRRLDVVLQKKQKENDEPISSLIPDPSSDPWNLLEQRAQMEEEKAIVSLAKQTIEQQFSQQAPPVQLVLQLELGLELIQSDIVQLIGVQLEVQKQYQLARLIGRYKRPLLLAFVQALQQAHPDLLPLNRSADTLTNQLKEAFEDYLAQHCQRSFPAPLEAAWQHFNSDQRLLLLLHYRQKLEAKAVDDRLQISNPEARIEDLTQTLCLQLQQWIEATWELDLSQGKTTIARLRSFTERWLEVQATLNQEDRP